MKALKPGEYDVNLNGFNHHYTIRGAGPALIMHSGGPGTDARWWADYAGIDEFATIIAIHPRGSGLSAPPPDGTYSLADYASDVEALRRHLQLERPYLLGWSHGGMVAQKYVLTYPDKLAGLILYDSSAHMAGSKADLGVYKDRPWYAESYPMMQRMMAGDYKNDEELAVLFGYWLRFLFWRFELRGQDYHNRHKQFIAANAPRLFFNKNEAPVFDLRPGLGAVRVPTLVVCGRHDVITPLRMSEEIASLIPGARLEILEESGHFAHVEEPEKLRTLVKEFMKV